MSLTVKSVLKQYELIGDSVQCINFTIDSDYLLQISIEEDFVKEISSVLKGKNAYIGSELLGTIKTLDIGYPNVLWCIVNEGNGIHGRYLWKLLTI